MRFLKKSYKIRRFQEPVYVNGYSTIPCEDIQILADIQTTDDSISTTADGSTSVQRIKVFCDTEILVERPGSKQKADRIFFQGRWFECKSCRLSENTPLRHYTATFVECLDQEVDEEDDV